MGDQREGGIAWTDQTWNPIRGCSRVSEGCRNCYAERDAGRFSGPGQAYEGLVRQTSDGPRWTGKVKEVPEHLRDPLRWQRPRRVFVNSMSDLFHESLPDAAIDRIFVVMHAAPAHVFQLLTKRPERMAAYLEARHADPEPWRHEARKLGLDATMDQPPENAWYGISVEDQPTADQRIPILMGIRALLGRTRWLSLEPLIAPVDLTRWTARTLSWQSAGGPSECPHGWAAGLRCPMCNPSPDWIVIGGESGPGARPFNLRWARELVRQAREAYVPVFVKQLGAVPVVDEGEWRQLSERFFGGKVPADTSAFAPGLLLSAVNREKAPEGTVAIAAGEGRKGADMEWWPEDLRVRTYPVNPDEIPF